MIKDFIKYQLLTLIIATLFLPIYSKSDESRQDRIEKQYEIIQSHIERRTDSLGILYFRLGRLYAANNQYDSAYKYYDISLNIANKTNDKTQLARLNNIIGSFYYKYENLDEAQEYYNRSYSFFKEINDPRGIASLLSNLGEIQRLKGEYRKALDNYFPAVKINEEYAQYANLSINHNNIGLTYAHLNKYDSAYYHLKIAESIAVDNELNNSLNFILNSLGTYYLLTDKYDSSLLYLSKAFKQSVDLNLLFQIKENSYALSQLFEKLENTDSAFYYHKIFQKYNDSILNNTNLVRIGLLTVKNKIENERRIEKIEQSRKELYYIILFISVLLVLIILLFLWSNQRNKTRHSQLKMKHLSLEKKYLNNELTDFALHISQSNHLLEEIKQSLKQLDLNEKNSDHIKELKLKLNTGLSNSQNKKILDQKVDEQHREFILLLKSKHPMLTKSEVKLCSLLKLNLTTKDIAAINKVSPQAVKVARYRLRKKLKVESDILINDYLNTIQ